LTSANPRTNPKRRALRHDYNLRSWKTKLKEVKTETLAKVKVELKLPNRRNEKEHEFRVLLTRRITFSKLKGGYCCALVELLFQTREKRGGLFLERRQK